MSEPDDKDIELFRASVEDVKPLTQDIADTGKPQPEAIPAQLHLDEEQAAKEFYAQDYSSAELSLGDEIEYLKPGLQYGLLRKLKRGQYSTGDEIDLHGSTATEAKGLLTEFIKECLKRHISCVRIIHGKGWGSGNKGPVLKPMAAKLLAKHDSVLAYCTARPTDGGTGALYVLLKK